MTQEQIIAYWNGYIDGKNNTLDKYAKIKKQKIKAEEDFGSEYDCGYQAGYTVAKKECVTDNNKTSVDDDEEIRKEIRDFVCWAIDRGSITKEQREKSNSWLAYLEKQKEQKPNKQEWSKEDEEMRITILQDIANIKAAFPKVNIQPEFDWLKSLPERFNLQPKQEWSEDYNEEKIQTRFAFYTYKDDPSVLYLSNVFVEETSRNHGFGTRILRAAEKVAETIGATTISLKVKQNSPANAWYRKNGYGYVTFEDGYDWLEKNLEYMKPNKQEWSEKDNIMLENIILCLKEYCLTDEINWLKSLCPQQKQEWSEEDEDMLNSCISSIEEAKENRYAYKETDGDTSYDHEIAWLKSLKNRGNFPKSNTNSPSWSEEDENMRLGIIGHLYSFIYPNSLYGDDAKECIAWLKSLRPQPQWRPSEEQMNHLKRCFSHGHTVGLPNQHVLESLYNDLQKLL